MPKVKRDKNPTNDYGDGYNAGRRYWWRKIKKMLKVSKKG